MGSPILLLMYQNESRKQVPARALPMIIAMLKAEAKARGMKSIGVLLEEWAMTYAVSPEARKVLVEIGDKDPLIKAFIKAKRESEESLSINDKKESLKVDLNKITPTHYGKVKSSSKRMKSAA